MACSLRILVITALILATAVEAAPFFDAIYDAINGNGRRSYGYPNYGNYGYYNEGYGYQQPRQSAPAPRQGKNYKEICRAHFPDSISLPGSGGIVCPY